MTSKLPTAAPMLATLVEKPFHRDGWVYEEKYDGIRLVAYKSGAKVRLMTRNDIDRATDFPSIVEAIEALSAPTLILDGEAVVLDEEGVSRFQLLQRRGLETSKNKLVFVTFDVLYARGRDLRALSLRERRDVLEREVPKRGPIVRSRRMDANGLRAFEMAREEGLEGIVAKDEESVYRAGARSDRWLKVKVRNEDEFVIAGFTPPAGSRKHFGAILIGAFEKGELRFAGKVGTGFSERVLADLARRFAPLVRKTSPFTESVKEKGVTWLEPKLVGQFAYTEITRDRRARHPVFLGLREDKAATKVHWPRRS